MAKNPINVRLYMTPEGPKIIESPAKSQIVSLLEKKELYFDEILVETDKSKPTLSNHLKILEDKGIIGSKTDAHDKRKKSFYIKAKQLVELSTNVELDIDVKNYFKNSLIQVNDPISYYALLFRTIRLFLINNGIDIRPLLFNIGISMGESIYEYVKSSNTKTLVESLAELWNKFELGHLELARDDPLTIHIYDNFECRDMLNIGESNCAIGAGIFESVFSKHFQSEVLVDEVKCYAKGNDYCCFDIKKVEKKVSPTVKGAIEFI